MCPPSALAIGLARVGQGAAQVIVSGTLAQLARVDFGPPLHSLVLVGGDMHELEAAMFEHFRWREGGPWGVWDGEGAGEEEDAGGEGDSDDDDDDEDGDGGATGTGGQPR